MSLFSTIFSYCLVGVLWGTTNPFIKYGQAIYNKKRMRMLQQEYDELHKSIHLSSDSNDESILPVSHSVDTKVNVSSVNSLRLMFSEPLVYLPFLVNQSGSFVFMYVLIREPISIAAPVCNSLAFIFTAITGHFVFKEEVQSPTLLILGILFVLSGIYICISNEK